MRYLFLLFALVFLAGCFSSKRVSSSNYAHKQLILSVEEQRKFDYFFYEANKEKFLGNIDKSVSYYIECLRIDSTSSVCMYELASVYANANQPAKAIGLVQRAVFFNPSNEWYQLTLADLYHRTNNFQGAILIYQDLVKKHPQEDDYLYTLSQLYAQVNKFDQALDCLNKLEQNIGFNETIIMEKMKIFIHLKREKKAYDEVNKLIKKYPAQVFYYGYLADLYAYFKKFDSAISTYNKMLVLDPEFETVYFSLSGIDLQKNDTLSFKENFIKAISSKNVELDQKIQKLLPLMAKDEKSISIFTTDELNDIFQKLITLHPFESQSYILYGNYQRSLEEPLKALSLFKSAIDLDPSNEQLWQDILFLDIELQKIDDLLADGSRSLLYFPANGVLSLLYSSGLLQKNRPNDAITVISGVIPQITNNPPLKGQLYALLGDASYKAGLSDSAFVAYEEALKINDKNLGVLNNYSYYLSVENKELDKAEKMSSRTIELEPGNSTFLDTYAWILFQKKRYFEAKFIIERAIDNGGQSNFEIVEHYGDILFFNNDVQAAVIEWKKALILLEGQTNEYVEPQRISTLKLKIETQSFHK